MKRPAPRQMLLGGLLASSLVATAWVARVDEGDTVTAAPRRAVAARTASAQPIDWPGPPGGARTAWPPPDAQALLAWGDAPALAAAPAAPTAPASVEPPPDESPALPFPYRLVGRMTDSQPRVVLDSAQRSLVLGVHDVVDGQWRVEAIDAGGLRVKRLPDGPSQWIAFPPS